MYIRLAYDAVTRIFESETLAEAWLAWITTTNIWLVISIILGPPIAVIKQHWRDIF